MENKYLLTCIDQTISALRMKRTMELESPIYYGKKCEVSAFVFLVDFERYTQFKEMQTLRESLVLVR